MLIYGNIDTEMVIDHLDGNPFNNNIKNLSLKTLAGNARNRHKQKDNKTGITGVCLSRARENTTMWQIGITLMVFFVERAFL